jgi:phosphatidylinositol alpha-mannosyltransferase
MKIAISSLYLPSNSKIGVGYQVHYMANELVKRGHQVTVFSQSGRSEDSLYDAVAVPNGDRFRTFGFAWNLRKQNFDGFDVLHACGDDWFLWGKKKPRLVHTFMGSCLAEMFNIRGVKERARMGLLALFELNATFLADTRVAISENTRHYIPRIQHIVPCGVDVSAFSPTENKSPHPTLLFVGTMHGRKRGQMLLDLFKTQIKPQVPDAEFWAVCESPVEGDGVRWFGRIPTDELTDLFRRAWVFCLPSTYEGFGVPYIEAMASGTPVVATPNVGAREVLQEGKSGLVVKDEELAATLVRVLTDADLRQKLRTAGLARAQDFSWERVCDQYLALYKGEPMQPRTASAVS